MLRQKFWRLGGVFMPSFVNFTGNGSLYIYKATYTIAAWTGDDTNGYTQTVSPVAVESGSPAISSKTQLSGPMTQSTNVKATNEALLAALNIINSGYSTTKDNGTVVTTVFEKPVSDIVVYWYGNRGE